VVGRGKSRRKPNTQVNGNEQTPPQPKVAKKSMPSSLDLIQKRAPKKEAIVISNPADSESYSSVMKRVLTGVNLQELDLQATARRTKSGAIILEVDGTEKADRLAGKLRQVLGTNASIGRPTRKSPILIVGIPDWIDVGDVRQALISISEDMADVQVTIHTNNGGGRVARADIPIGVAIKLAEQKYLTLGWGRCRIKLLEKKNLNCYRCQGRNHVAARCNAAEASRRCYKCGRQGHIVRESPGTPRSPTASAPTSVPLNFKLDQEKESVGSGKPTPP